MRATRFEMSVKDNKLTLNQWSDGWAGAGYDHQTVEIRGRRVQVLDRDEAQLEIAIMSTKGNRLYEKNASIVIPADAIPAFIEMLQGKLNH